MRGVGKSSIFLLVLAGIFLISFSSLMLQVTITRIFSVTLYYHYAFVTVSVALFGWGLGGLFLHFQGKKKVTDTSLVIATYGSLIFAISIQIYLWIIVTLALPISFFVVYYILSMIPFFLGGISSAAIFRNFAGKANKLYFADLIGASLGSLLVEPVINPLGPGSTILILGVTASLASLFLSLATQRKRLISLSLIGLTITATVFTASALLGNANSLNSPTKSMFAHIRMHNLTIDSTKWNSFSRVDVVTGWPDAPYNLAMIYIDADAGTEITKWDGSIQNGQFLKDTIDFLPYNLVDAEKTLIIGSGGGRDVAIALVGGSSEIVAVELNPIIVEIVKSYGEKAGNVYNNEKVDIIVDEGRSFISRSQEKYDVIVLTMVDSFAAIAAGGYALSENYLYTVEAFDQYIDHLTDDGILLVIRWYKEIPRLVSSIAKTLILKGMTVEDAGKHLAIVLNEIWTGFRVKVTKAVFMVKKSPFNLTEVQVIENKTQTNADCTMFYIPFLFSESPYADLFNGTISLEEFYENFPMKVSPVSDNDPYYFAVEKPLPATLRDVIILFSLFIGGFISIPWLFKKSNKAKAPFSFIIFFSTLGIGFMLLEIVILQRFILFLGYPTRALSVILFSLLLSSGVGSFVSSYISRKEIVQIIIIACLSIILLVASYALLLPSVFSLLLPQEANIRILVTFFLLFPLGFFMGMPFPTGLRILSTISNEKIPWMWAINGGFSVFGAVVATTIGIMWGLNYAMLLGAVAYFISFICAWHLKKFK
jgi:predicted membrane-bound spermidine synthase